LCYASDLLLLLLLFNTRVYRAESSCSPLVVLVEFFDRAGQHAAVQASHACRRAVAALKLSCCCWYYYAFALLSLPLLTLLLFIKL
jgi:hypothetical protein